MAALAVERLMVKEILVAQVMAALALAQAAAVGVLVRLDRLVILQVAQHSAVLAV
jgi:hypothetical protein